MIVSLFVCPVVEQDDEREQQQVHARGEQHPHHVPPYLFRLMLTASHLPHAVSPNWRVMLVVLAGIV